MEPQPHAPSTSTWLFPGFPWRFVFLLFLVLTVITLSVPLTQYLTRPEGTVYTGYSLESLGDISYYTNYINQAKEGATLFHLYAAPTPHPALWFNPLFLALGKMAALFHLSAVAAWHLGRTLLLLVFLLLLVTFLQELGLRGRALRVAAIFIVVTGGVYNYVFEASTFLGLLYSPLLALTLCLTLLYCLLLLRIVRTRRVTVLRCAALLGIWALQATAQSYVLIAWLAFAASLLLMEWRRQRWGFAVAVRCALPFVFGALLGFALVAWQFSRGPMFTTWAVGNTFAVWGWQMVLLNLAPLLPLALVGIHSVREKVHTDLSVRFLLLWSIVLLGLFLSPYPYSTRLFFFLHLPLAVFASLGARHLWQHSKRSFLLAPLVLFLVVLSLSDNLHHLYQNLERPQSVSDLFSWEFRERAYLTPEVLSLANWVRTTTPQDAVFLTAPKWDATFATLTNRYVYVTAGALTPDVQHRVYTAHSIYAGEYAPNALHALLSSAGVTHVLVGPWELRIALQNDAYYGQQLSLGTERYPFLHVAYDENGYTVYEVEPIVPSSH